MKRRRRVKLGKAFSDNVVIGERQATRLSSDRNPPWWVGSGRALLFSGVMFAVFFVLIVRLFHLTVIAGHRYRNLADNNRTRELVRHAPRGQLLDRTGEELTKNISEFRYLKPCDDAPDLLCTERISQKEGEELSVTGLPEDHFLEVDFLREYRHPHSLAHVVGYLGELTQDELDSSDYVERSYLLGDSIGRMGAEEVFEDRLRGRNGKELVEVDAQGRIVRVLGTDNDVPGDDMFLAVDAQLADVVMDAFPSDSKGAVIVSKPQTGEILALYSSPTFDPNAFTLGMSQEDYDALINDEDMPLFDRAIGGEYPPGSTFKLITAIAGLESGAITASTTYEDTGIITIGPYSYTNWYYTKYGGTDGIVDMVKALARSNDIYFYRAGEEIGIDTLDEWARRFGINKTLDIELSGEVAGVMPNPAWKQSQFDTAYDRKVRNDQWYLGDTFHVAIGQGYLLTTPLHVNAWTSVVANGGRLCRPTIQKVQGRTHRAICRRIDIEEEHIRTVVDGMIQACQTGGTAWPLFNFGIVDEALQVQDASPSATLSKTRVPVACKTGTAEFGGEADDDTHAWITLFAPVPEEYVSGIDGDAIVGTPEISVTVLVEEGGEGSDVAAPIAKKILEEWFGR